MEASICILEALPASIRLDYFLYWALVLGFSNKFVSKMFACSKNKSIHKARDTQIFGVSFFRETNSGNVL
jgi:hypothetical protein